MTIEKTQSGNIMTLTVSGRLDTTTAPSLEEAMPSATDGVIELHLDFKDLEYISSAGLRVLISGFKTMQKKEGTMSLENINEAVREVFEITGLNEIFGL